MIYRFVISNKTATVFVYFVELIGLPVNSWFSFHLICNFYLEKVLNSNLFCKICKSRQMAALQICSRSRVMAFSDIVTIRRDQYKRARRHEGSLICN